MKKQNKNDEKDIRKNVKESSAGENITKTGTTEVVFILDRSGSMTGLEDDTIGGFNATLKEQKESGREIIWSTILFDDKYEVIHDRVPVSKVKELTRKEYYVRGCTALLDAVGLTVHHISHIHRHAKGDAPDKTLFVITTDGMENASMEYSYRKVKKMISHETEKHGWEFMFLGANIDAAEEADRLGIRADMAATYINDGEGIRMHYGAVSSAMGDFCDFGSIAADCLEEVRKDFARRKK